MFVESIYSFMCYANELGTILKPSSLSVSLSQINHPKVSVGGDLGGAG